MKIKRSDKKTTYSPRNYSLPPWALTLFVALFTFTVYIPALNNGFVYWDDLEYVVENTAIHKLDQDTLRWSFSSFYASNWHPLTWLSHAIDYRLWQLNPWGHHLTNLILHVLNTLLLMALTYRLIGAARFTYDKCQRVNNQHLLAKYNYNLAVAALAGLLFGIHPIHVESVAWVSERKDVLCASFFLLTIIGYLRYASEQDSKRKRLYYAACLTSFLLALMSKPMAVTLPVVLLLIDLYPLRRLPLKVPSGSDISVLLEKIPFFILSLASSIVTLFAQRLAIENLEAIPLSKRLLTALKGFYFYLQKTLLPLNLSPLYPYDKEISALSIDFIAAVLILVTITVFCVITWRRRLRLFSIVWAYYIITLLPVIGIIQVGAQAVADRYGYLPTLGFFILIALAFEALYKRVGDKGSLAKVALSTLVVCLVVSLSLITLRQIGVWKDTITLWSRAIEVLPTSSELYFKRGWVQGKEGRLQEAISDMTTAIKLNPNHGISYFHRGVYYSQSGSFDKAISDFNTALTLMPNDDTVYSNRGAAYMKIKEYSKGMADFNRAIEINPKNYAAHINRCVAYLENKDYKQTIISCNHALQLQRETKKSSLYAFEENQVGQEIAHYNIAVAYHNTGNTQKAIETLNRALQLNPDYALAYNERGIILGGLKEYQKALSDFTRAIRINPNYAEAYYNRGATYYRLNNKDAAMDDFKAAARLGNKQLQEFLKGKGISW